MNYECKDPEDDKCFRELKEKLDLAIVALKICNRIDKSDYDKYKIIKYTLDKIGEINE